MWFQSIREDANCTGKGRVSSTGIALYLCNSGQATQDVVDDDIPHFGIGAVSYSRFGLHNESILTFKFSVKMRYCLSMPRKPMFWVPAMVYTGTRSESAAETPVP